MNNDNQDFHNDWGMPEENSNISQASSINKDEWGEPENQFINTIIGKLPKNIPELKPGTEENKQLLNDMITGAALNPGMKMVGTVTTKLPGIVKTLLSKVNPRNWVNSVRKGHDLLQEESSGIYDLIKNQVKKKNLNIKVDDDILNYAARHLPDTTKTRSLLKSAREGKYEAIHDLQSSLGDLGSQAKTSALTRNAGEEMLDARNLINDAIQNNFIKYGESDLAHLLKKGRNIFRNKMETYYEHPGIGRMVRPKLRKTPKNITNFFSEESEPMANILKTHPEIKNELELLKEKENIINNIKLGAKIGIPTTVGLGGTGYLLRNLLSPSMNDTSNNNYGNQ